MKNGIGKAVSKVNSDTSRMTLVRLPVGRTMTNSIKIEAMTATRDDGTTLKILRGSFGKNSMSNMLEKQITSIQVISEPDFHSCVSGSWNGCNCASPITNANPLQNPIITGAGSKVMNRESSVADTTSMSTPANITEGKSNSTPGPFSPVPAFGMKVPMIAAKAPVAPLTMPGRPPKRLHVRPTIHAACNAIGGLICAMNAKATDSGIWAKQMVTPSKISRTR
mmetsp:Transcript_109394/g.214413  ORF Transcript_109394/g.214413 Transcript_109394/m.214413 type:complete len:223 (-) Transcript_109394:196-864(-)